METMLVMRKLNMQWQVAFDGLVEGVVVKILMIFRRLYDQRDYLGYIQRRLMRTITLIGDATTITFFHNLHLLEPITLLSDCELHTLVPILRRAAREKACIAKMEIEQE